NSAITPAASKMKGAISQNASARGFASGRASRSVNKSVGKAKANESTNFIQKRIDPVAAATSGLGPSNRQYSATLPRKPMASAAATRRPSRIGSGIGSAASAAMSSEVFTR